MFPASNRMNRQTKQRLIILGLATLAVFGVYVFMLLKTTEYAGEASTLARSLREKRAQSETLVSQKRIVSDTAPARKELERYFVASEGVVDFIERIEKIAKNIGVALIFNTVEVPKEERVVPSLDRLVLRFSATGSWEQVMRFFALVESLPYALSVADARVEKRSLLLWQAVVTITAYKHS